MSAFSGPCAPQPDNGIPRPATAALNNQRGVALIVVILMLSVIVSLTIQLNRDMRAEMYEAINLSDRIQLGYVARSGIYAAEALLLADKNTFDALTEDWANTEMAALKSEELFDNASFRLAIEDEGGKIPLNALVNASGWNAAVRDMLLRLLVGPYFRLQEEEAGEIVDSLRDYIDADSETTGRGEEGGAKNAPLDCIEELLMIKGVSRELFYGSGEVFGLSRCVGIFGDGKININTAPKPVLLALSAEMTAGAVEALDEYRRDEKNSVATPGWHSAVPGAAGANIPAALTAVASNVFQIKAEGVKGNMTERIAAIVRRDEVRKKITILSWRVE